MIGYSLFKVLKYKLFIYLITERFIVAFELSLKYYFDQESYALKISSYFISTMLFAIFIVQYWGFHVHKISNVQVHKIFNFDLIVILFDYLLIGIVLTLPLLFILDIIVSASWFSYVTTSNSHFHCVFYSSIDRTFLRFKILLIGLVEMNHQQRRQCLQCYCVSWV